VYDVEPARQPDLYAQRPLVIVGKYRGAPGGEIVVRGFTGHGRFERRIRVERDRTAASNEVLKYLWARERLALLSDFGIADGGNSARRQQVTDLGLKYGLLTEFTSFVAIDQRVRRSDGRLETVKQPLPLPQGVSDLAVGGTAAAQRGIVTEALAVAAAPPMFDARSSRKTEMAQAPPPPPPPPQDGPRTNSRDRVSVEIVENRLSGGSLTPAAVTEVVRRALRSAACAAALAGGPPTRLKIAFNAQGGIDRVEGATGAISACVRSALQRSGQLPGVTGGYIVVTVSWS
jgi:Ca-activated chloride channel family protein